jgi:hypothetical protein
MVSDEAIRLTHSGHAIFPLEIVRRTIDIVIATGRLRRS